MKRIAFAAAAAALLGTGCVSSSPETGSVNVYWSFQKWAPAQQSGHIDYDTSFLGTATGPCAQSAVETVTVDSPLGQTTVPCVHENGVQGLGIDGLPAGPHSFRLRGNRGGLVVYDTTVSLDVHPNMVMDYDVVVTGVYRPLEMFAYLSYAPNLYYTTCASASNPTVDYDVYDWHGNAVLSGSVFCLDPANPFMVVQEDLDLDNYTVRMIGYIGNAQRAFDSCTSESAKLLAFDHFAVDTGANGVPVTLSTPVACTL